jgi:hypothetical protein
VEVDSSEMARLSSVRENFGFVVEEREAWRE